MKVLTKKQIQDLLDLEKVIEITEKVYQDKSQGQTVVWPTTFYEFDPGKADMDIKSGYLPELKVFGHKTVSFFADNLQKQLPNLLGMITVFSSETGLPLGALEAAYITGLRTGAAGAIGAKYLAKPESKTLFILGAGNQAAFQIAATISLFPHLEKVYIADVLHPAKARQFAAAIPQRLQEEFQLQPDWISFEAAENLAAAVAESDIIITVTPSKSPLIKKEWVTAGTHFSCIGADASGKEELEPEIFKDALVILDDRKHCMEAGEIEIPLKKGLLQPADIAGEIGDLILGKIAGRTSPEEITIFDATGMAILDLALAKLALDRAEAAAIGQTASIL